LYLVAYKWQWYQMITSLSTTDHRIQFREVSVSQGIVTLVFGTVTDPLSLFFWTVFSRYCIPVDVGYYYGQHECGSEPF